MRSLNPNRLAGCGQRQKKAGTSIRIPRNHLLTSWSKGSWQGKEDSTLSLEVICTGGVLPIKRILGFFLSADAGLESYIGNKVSLFLWFRPLLVQALCIGGNKEEGSNQYSDDGLHGNRYSSFCLSEFQLSA